MSVGPSMDDPDLLDGNDLVSAMSPTVAGEGHKGETLYEVRFVGRDELPDGHDWFIARQGDDYVFMVDKSKLSEKALTDAWVAFCKLADC